MARSTGPVEEPSLPGNGGPGGRREAAIPERVKGRVPDACLDGSTLWIDGAWSKASDGGHFRTSCPSDGGALLDIAEAHATDVDRAAAAAHGAARAWAELDGAERGRILRRVAEGIRGHAEALAHIETLDSGRVITDTRGAAAKAAALFDFYAGFADKIHGHCPPAGVSRTALVEREPFGAIAAIAPWNYPLGNAVTKLAPILACGNTVVLKPAEQTPLVTLLLASIMRDAGIPKGVVNIVTGGGAAGAALVRHPLIAKISFTGSTQTGRQIAAEAGRQLKGVVLELGGKSPLVVFDDADIEAAASAAVFTAFMNLGQTCTSCNRVLVADSVKERFLALCETKLAALRIGDPFDPATRLGAIVSPGQLERIRSLTEGVAGRPLALPHYKPIDGGNFFRPMIVDGFDADSAFARQEIFGPVLSVTGFADDEEAYAAANDTEYGLAASVWTSSLGRAERARRRIAAGVVWVNCVHSLTPGTPVSGHKASGLGSEYGLEAAEHYMKIKTTVVMAGGWTSPFEPASVSS